MGCTWAAFPATVIKSGTHGGAKARRKVSDAPVGVLTSLSFVKTRSPSAERHQYVPLMVTLAVVWAVVKKHWRLVLATFGVVFAAIAGALLFNRAKSGFADQLKAINDAHATELKQITDARAQEEAQHQLNEKQLQTALDAVQKQYDAAQKQLDDTKKAEVAQLVKQYGDDPNALAQKLSEATGFSVIPPTQ